MKTRTITGFFFVIVMLGSMLLKQYVFGGFYLLLSCLCLYEFYKLVSQKVATPDVTAGMANAILVYSGFAVVILSNNMAMPWLLDYKQTHALLFLLPVSLAFIFIRQLFVNVGQPFTNIGYTFLGILLIIVPFTFFYAIAYTKGSYNAHFPLSFFILLWANDTGAYLVGRFLGRTKLFERHSPKKTWEGFIGGVVISAGAALIVSHYFDDLTWGQWVTIAVLISCFGTLGDLVESMFKRSIDVKDSGNILPGHGGLLDRFDGLLLAAPVVYTYLYFITN